MNVSASISALQAFSLSQEITANNVANINTNEFKSSRLDLEDGPNGQGVRPETITQSTEHGGWVQEIQVHEDENGQMVQTTEYVESSNTDLARESVQMIVDTRAFQANVNVIRNWEEMTGSIMDIFA